VRRRLWATLLGTVGVVVILLVFNIAAGNTPVLGLDLQGGVSVIVAPAGGDASTEDLTVIRDLIRDELESRGFAEPDVRVQGDTIVVDLPGVKDQQDALDAVDVSGVVELRPVLPLSECSDALTPTVDTGSQPSSDSTPSDTPGSTPATDVPTDTGTGTSGGGTSEPAGLRMASPDTVPTDTVGSDSVPAGSDVPTAPIPLDDSTATPATSSSGAELLQSRDGTPVCVGPAQGTGEVFTRGSAQVTADQGWGVSVDLRGDGQALWNSLASQCYNTMPSCPSVQPGLRGQIAIVLDSVVQSSPQVNQPNFDTGVAITGNFTRSEAGSLASVLNRGAFPVEIQAQEARTVSASAGTEALKAAVIAGAIGVIVVLAFLLAYYRGMAIVVVGGLIVWAMAVFSAASLVSKWTNYALSLAGITGIIVAVGVTVDSYIVFFERMKDEVRNGRTLKNAAPRSFNVTWRTIWTADLVSVIGAAILFWLSVGSVRGFALYLGLTTLCDLFVCYFFTRPAVLLISRSDRMAGKKVFGLEVAPA